jgi:hypothetical protein
MQELAAVLSKATEVPLGDVAEYLAAAGVSGSGLFSFMGDNQGAKQLIREWHQWISCWCCLVAPPIISGPAFFNTPVPRF